jgi:hypothetical protein
MTTKYNPSDAQERQGVAIAELLISKSGHIFREQEANDVGIDAHIELVDVKTHGATGQLIALQIKSGSSFFQEFNDDAVTFRGKLQHLDYWLNHSLPVFLVLVDTEKQKAYWQEISRATIERLEKGWKVAVPFIQKLETNFVSAAQKCVGLEPNAFSYTRLSLEDTSNPNAKRYSAKILMRPPITRLRAEAVIRQATAEIRKETYQRSSFFEELFHNRDADVVSLYVAGDLNDPENSNWYCRTVWVSKNIPKELRPASIGGVDFGDGLEIVWGANYAKEAQFYNSLQIGKSEFVTEALKFVANAKELIEQTFSDHDSQIVCTPKLMAQHAILMSKLFIESNNIGLPPYECKDVAQRFQDVMAIADNAFIYGLKMNDEPQNKGWVFLLETTLKDYRKNLNYFQYELEKTR